MIKTTTTLLATIFLVASVFAQEKGANTVSTYTYQSVANDPLKVRIYKLKNGMTVYLSVNKDAPRIQTYIAVKAGSKNDPADATGLAHYLEHMVFKGTDVYGTKDFKKEEPLIAEIENLYEVYRKTKDPVQRAKIYRKIDSVSGVAAKYAIANEYDKMVAIIGVKDNNAFTSDEETVYTSDIPSNQIDNWLKIEAEKFRKPILRLFHTELEAVYEEKNRSLDSDGSRAWDSLISGLFKKHNYGLQTTIGTVEHLKNPSMKEIRAYYDKYYVANNMAIIMSGDLEYEATIKLIDFHFGKMIPKAVQPYTFSAEDPITKTTFKEVFGPKAEDLLIGFRFLGSKTKESKMLALIARILFNQKAGIMDEHLFLKQKVQECGAFEVSMNDYSILLLTGAPKQDQKLEEVMQLLLDQVERLKKGEFPDWLVEASINQLRMEQIKKYETNADRVDAMLDAFSSGEEWKDAISELDEVSKYTKKDVIDFANKHLGNNYVAVLKRTGEEKKISKVDKPVLTPVDVNRNDQSEFLKQVGANHPKEIEPVFVDFAKDLKHVNLPSGVEIIYNQNTENELFELAYVFEEGRNNNKILPIAIQYLDFLPTTKHTSVEIQEELFKLGGNYNFSVETDRIILNVRGLTKNFDAIVKIAESLLNDGKEDLSAFESLKESILKQQEDARKNKDVILKSALKSYALHGSENPFTYSLTPDELKKLQASAVIMELKKLKSFHHTLMYYGPLTFEDFSKRISTIHAVETPLKPFPPEKIFKTVPTEKTVYVVDFDMQQAEIMMVSRSESFNTTNLPVIELYNEYFSGGMSGIVFQELRESRALAYSCNSKFIIPNRKDKPFILEAYIGSQVDKLPEAMAGMRDLLDNMPQSDGNFQMAKEAMIGKIRSERITKEALLFYYENMNRIGYTTDRRKEVFEKLSAMQFSDIKAFQEKYIKDKAYAVLVIGKKSSLDIKTLEKYGKVVFLELNDVFGH